MTSFTVKTNFRLLAVALLALCSMATRAPAVTLYEYDFDDLSAINATTVGTGQQNLTGQDGWQTWAAWADTLGLPASYTGSSGTWVSTGLEVINDAPGNSTIAVKQGQATLGGIGSRFAGNVKLINPITFTPSDTAIEQYVSMMFGLSGSNRGTLRAGFVFGGQDYTTGTAASNVYGMLSIQPEHGNTVFTVEWNSGSTERVSGTTALTTGDWYEIRSVMDFSVGGGVQTISFRNVTTSGPWITDPSLTNIAMGLIPDNDGNYKIVGFGIINQRDNVNPWHGAQYYDNFRLVNPNAIEIPEPSALALGLLSGIGCLLVARRRSQKNF